MRLKKMDMESVEKTREQLNEELKVLQQKFDLLNETYLEKFQKLDDSYIKNQKLLNEAGEMAKVGGWEFDLKTRKQLWTQEVYRIHEVDSDFIPTVDNGIIFFPTNRNQSS